MAKKVSLKHSHIPVIPVKGLTLEEYLELRMLAHGCDDPPDAGFSFVVTKSALYEWAKDMRTDNQEPPKYLLSILKLLVAGYGERDTFVLVLCEGEDHLVSFV